MDDEIQILMRKDTWEIVSRKSVADHNVLPVTWSFRLKRKPYWTISKFKARYCMIGDVQKKLSPEPLNFYYPVVQWATVLLMLVFQCIIGLHSQSIDFKMTFLSQIFQVGCQSSLNFPGISRLMENKVMLLSD